MKPAITEPGSLWRRLGWFVAIWAGSVAGLGAVAWLLRLVIHA
ncbi:MAG: DUF2474 domain-containing protein [Rhizorhabdus sp.]